MEIYVIYISIAIAIGWIFFHAKRPQSQFPKGPYPLPVLGNLLQLGRQPLQAFMQMKQAYGDIFSIQLGSHRAVVLNRSSDIKLALSNSEFADRPNFAGMLQRCGGKPRGIVFNWGTSWREQREFLIKQIGHFCGQKHVLEQSISDEICEIFNHFKPQNSNKVKIYRLFNVAVFNIVWKLLTGSRLPSEEARKIVSSKSTSSLKQWMLYYPWAFKVFMIFNWCRKSRKTATMNKTNLVGIAIKSCQQELASGKVVKSPSFVEEYLSEIQRTTQSSFKEEEGIKNLKMTMLDLIVGTETTSSTMEWLLLLLSLHPEKQEKLQKEIMSVVGNQRRPVLSDRPRMPYTKAILTEVLRYSAVGALAIPHCAADNTTLKEYRIPKGTVILTNLYAALHDSETWKNPYDFVPERFLSENGNHFVRKPEFIAFSSGARVCPGMRLAEDELFLLTTAVLQKYRFSWPAGVPKKISYTFERSLVPVPYELDFEEIKQM